MRQPNRVCILLISFLLISSLIAVKSRSEARKVKKLKIKVKLNFPGWWRYAKEIRGLTRIESTEDLKKLDGWTLLNALRLIQPFTYLFQTKHQFALKTPQKTGKLFLKKYTISSHAHIKAINLVWTKFQRKRTPESVQAGNKIWESFQKIGKEFKGHKYVLAAEKLKKLGPNRLYQFLNYVLTPSKYLIRRFARMKKITGGIFSLPALVKYRKRLIRYFGVRNGQKRFLRLFKNLRPFSGFAFTKLFRGYARLYKYSIFALQFADSKKFLKPTDLHALKNQFVFRYGRVRGTKLFVFFVKIFMRKFSNGLYRVKNYKLFGRLVWFYHHTNGTFKTVESAKKTLHRYYGKTIGDSVLATLRRRSLVHVRNVWRFSRRIRYAFNLRRFRQLRFIRKFCLKFKNKQFTHRSLLSFIRKRKLTFKGSNFKPKVVKYILRYASTVNSGFNPKYKIADIICKQVKIQSLRYKTAVAFVRKFYGVSIKNNKFFGVKTALRKKLGFFLGTFIFAKIYNESHKKIAFFRVKSAGKSALI